MTISLRLAPYVEQQRAWPATGRHVLAQFDERDVVVYQAFRAEIADAAVRAGRFAEGFRLARMSWIKPNFLWMMFRCGWATKPGQERVLALRLPRAFFDRVLRDAVPSGFDPSLFGTREEWSRAVTSSSVCLQWDPDHSPSGAPVQRRAVQLGLRGDALAEYAAIARIEDVTPLVVEQRAHAVAPYASLLTPEERVYPS